MLSFIADGTNDDVADGVHEANEQRCQGMRFPNAPLSPALRCTGKRQANRGFGFSLRLHRQRLSLVAQRLC